MSDNSWDWYATQELANTIASKGLCCPRCERTTSRIDVDFEALRLRCRECGSDFSPGDYRASLRRPPKTGLSTLFRPVGENELAKIEASGFRRFPPRFEDQPIFYPVLTQEYAEWIARDWNSTDAGHNYIGFVTRFEVRNEFLCGYEIQTAADKETLEYWIPSEDLEAFNDHIAGSIQVVCEFKNGQLVWTKPVPDVGEVIVELTFLGPEHGGAHCLPVVSQERTYQPGLDVAMEGAPNHSYDRVILTDCPRDLRFNEPSVCVFELVSRDSDYSPLVPGAEVSIREASRVVARGRVLKRT